VISSPKPLQELHFHLIQQTNDDSLYNITTSMRAFQLGRPVGGRTVAFRNVSFPRKPYVAAVSFVRNAARQQSSSEKPSKAVQWTPHSLKDLQIPPSEDNTLLEASKKLPTVHTAYIALGSNLGDRIGWIEKACGEMSRRGIKIKRTSCLWETEPMYVAHQRSFINGVCEASPRIRQHDQVGICPYFQDPIT
jgi:2-amino-4-hydroxy-6-hydroxymethyldihydropteridine diphosphokinase/dihydropteroate synthase